MKSPLAPPPLAWAEEGKTFPICDNDWNRVLLVGRPINPIPLLAPAPYAELKPAIGLASKLLASVCPLDVFVSFAAVNGEA